MKLILSIIISSLILIVAAGGSTSEAVSNISQQDQSSRLNKRAKPSANKSNTSRTTAVTNYQIDPSRSRFMATVRSGGVLWFLGHTHHFAVKDFEGQAAIAPEDLTTASLQMTIKAASLEETGKNFTDQQKQIINKSARTEVLEVEAHPQIAFKSTGVTGEMKSNGQYELKIKGNLSLHGVTRPIEIPAQVTVNGNTLHSNGEFSINRSDYGIKSHAIKWGTIRVRNKIKFEFDIVANKV